MAAGNKALAEFKTAIWNVHCRTDEESGRMIDTRETKSADMAIGLVFDDSGDWKTRRQTNETVELACMMQPSDVAAIFSGCAWADPNGEIHTITEHPATELFAILQNDPKGKKFCKKVADILAAAERESDLKPFMCRSIKGHAKETK